MIYKLITLNNHTTVGSGRLQVWLLHLEKLHFIPSVKDIIENFPCFKEPKLVCTYNIGLIKLLFN